MEKQYCTAIVLAAGSGKRMGTKVHKQYLLMGGKPVLYYSLKAFEDSDLIDEIILVTGSGLPGADYREIRDIQSEKDCLRRRGTLRLCMERASGDKRGWVRIYS